MLFSVCVIQKNACCQSIHKVRAFAWVRKHGFASGWRAGDGIPSREVDEGRFAPRDRPHLAQSRIKWSCRDYSSASSWFIPHTSDPARNTFRTSRLMNLSCCLDPSHRLATHTRFAVGPGQRTLFEPPQSRRYGDSVLEFWRTGASAPSRH